MTEPLNPELLQLGGSAVADELREVIEGAILNHPRSLQSAIGPSEIGGACARKIGYKLLGWPDPPRVNWAATIGTAVHAWMENTFDLDNVARAPHLGGQERWYIEERVTVGYVPGMGFITGSCDLYDRITGTVIDWKVVGPTQLRKYKSQGPSAQYRGQAHLYGQGWANRGLPVSQVMICFLPRNGSLEEAYIWSEPWQPAVAKAALDRLARISQTCTEHGEDAPALLETAETYCGHCPYFKAGSADPRQGCPGDPASPLHNPQPALTLAPAAS